MKRILHICWGTGTNNGAANIARLIMDEQRAAGDEPVLVSRPSWTQLRAADQVWCHCGWYWVFWLVAAYKHFFHHSHPYPQPQPQPHPQPPPAPPPPPQPSTYLHWVPECCYDPIRLGYHGWKKSLVGPIERWALRQADVLVATCEAEAGWIREYLRQAAGEHVEHGEGPKIVVSDIKRFFNLNKEDDEIHCRPQPSTSTLNILYLGRPHPLKGVKYLEKAVEEINRHAEHVSLREVSNHIGEELERDWDWCDVLCLPTLSDNFGLVIAEALSRGKRVLTTDGAPAWDPEEKKADGESRWTMADRLFYLKGYRDGDDATRVKLLADALNHLAGRVEKAPKTPAVPH